MFVFPFISTSFYSFLLFLASFLLRLQCFSYTSGPYIEEFCVLSGGGLGVWMAVVTGRDEAGRGGGGGGCPDKCLGKGWLGYRGADV